MVGSSSRGGTHVLWVTVHTAEGIRKASDLKAFFERSTDSSAHAVADDSTLLDNLVPYDRAAWTLRNGNAKSDNLELCGFAAWTRAEWLNNHQGMLTQAANWIRSRCRARGIPIRKLSAADVRAGRAGVIGHVDYTNGTGDGTHWDPGPGFPWDVVIARAAGTAPSSTPVSGGTTQPAFNPEENMLRAPASAKDENGDLVYDHFEVPLGPNRQVFIAASYGRTVQVDGIAYVGPTPGAGGSDVTMDKFGGGAFIGADRPGPFTSTNDNAVHAVVRARADHAFTLYSK